MTPHTGINRSDSMEGLDELREEEEDAYRYFTKNLLSRQPTLVTNDFRAGNCDAETLLRNKGVEIIADMRDRIDNFIAVEETSNNPSLTMEKLMKRIQRLDRQSERIKQPMFSGIQLDP